MRKLAFIAMMAVFAINISVADDAKLPAYDQVKKLVDAVWKPMPTSIDITYYVTVKDEKKTRESLLKFYREIFDQSYGPDRELSPEMLERKINDIEGNVDKDLAAEQHGGRKVKYRIRGDGVSSRIDRVDGSPEINRGDVVGGKGGKKFVPGKILDKNTAYERSQTRIPAADKGYEVYEYYYDLESVSIQKSEKERVAIEDLEVVKVLKMPCVQLLQSHLGKWVKNEASGHYVVDEALVKQLCLGALNDLKVIIESDDKEPDLKDKITIKVYNKDHVEILTALMICDKDDYSKVYYFQTPDATSGKPLMSMKTYSDYDNQGIAHNFIETQYDDKGNVSVKNEYKIEDVQINIQVPQEVFVFNPPDGYMVTDYRLSESDRVKAKVEFLKKRLKDKKSAIGRKFEAFVLLEDMLKDNPEQLIEVAKSVLDDEDPEVRKMAEAFIKRAEKEKNSEKE